MLEQALIDETVKGKFTDFHQGAGADALKKLDLPSYMALLSDLARAPEPAVRRRAVATLSGIDNIGANRILHAALNDPSLSVRM